MARVPASTPSQAEGKDVGAFDDRDATEWATTLNDVRDYGADLDGSSDDSQALRNAISDSLGDDEAAYIPREGDTMYLGSAINIDSSLSGATIVGDGFDSHVQSNSGGHVSGIFSLWDPDYPISDFTIANINVEGEGGNSRFSSYSNQYGIRVRWDGASGEYADENIQVENCWVHDCNSSNMSFSSQDNHVRHCSVYRSGQWHGCSGFNVSPNNRPRQTFKHILGWQNGQQTLDLKAGDMEVDVIMSINDAQEGIGAGFKTSQGPNNTHGTSTLNRIHVEDSNNHGVNMTGDAVELNYDNVVVINADKQGFAYQNGGTLNAGSLYAINCTENGVWFGNGGTIEIDVDYIETCNNGTHGVTLRSDATGDIRSVVGQGNAGRLVNNNGTVAVHNETVGPCEIPDVIPDRTSRTQTALGLTSASGLHQTTAAGHYDT